MTAPLAFLTDSLTTPIGQLIYICDSQGALRMVDWSDHEARALRLLDIHYGKGGYTVAKQRDPFGLTTRFAAYFAGDIHAYRRHPHRHRRHCLPARSLACPPRHPRSRNR
jgi:methylated-DNA-[protein]-cysteine S-methyltransferase